MSDKTMQHVSNNTIHSQNNKKAKQTKKERDKIHSGSAYSESSVSTDKQKQNSFLPMAQVSFHCVLTDTAETFSSSNSKALLPTLFFYLFVYFVRTVHVNELMHVNKPLWN